MSQTDSSTAPETDQLDALVVGAGWGGVYMLYRLRQLGLKVRLYEAGSGVGGTWFWNRYPGARCDTPSLQYSFSFSEPLQQEYDWNELYAAQPEIERYANHVADRFDLRKDMQFNTRVTSAIYDEERNRWYVTLDGEKVVSTTFIIMATGGYSIPVKPDIPGIDSFGGEMYYTAAWPQHPVDFAKKRIGVVGTGSSGMQTSTAIAHEDVDHLYVFQRTANFIVPARNAPMDPDYQVEYKKTYPDRRERARHTSGGFDVMPIDPATGPTDELSDGEFYSRADTAWQFGGISAMNNTFKDLATNEAANERVAEYLRDQVRNVVIDQSTAELLCARDHYLGSRRILISDDYLQIFNQENVTLVNVKKDPIEKVTEKGIVTAGGEYELDMIVFATGFDSGSGAMLQVNIEGRHGLKVADKWAKGPLTYLGIGIEGFPNLFMIAQAGSPGIRSLVMVSIEQHVQWITSLISYARDHGVVTIEPTAEAESSWSAYVAEAAERTLFFRDDTQFVGSNVPGKPRVYTSYVGGVGRYRDICDQVQANEYEGWWLETASGDVSGPREWSGPDSAITSQVSIQ